ncbi:RC-LH1 core complex protein PufX [uncultured Litoreibacter sp.]|uniref:RC-LH1 core complex protein PufX n=1 Tax=uncultured Litoreibacter sp. TaxID=1392394 RepID=UPI0026231993|nr:RC-LH1 core complex protein PufX [uncultured Litoreibacter sp.]
MKENHDYLSSSGGSNIARLREEGLMLHMKGAGYAFIFCFAVLTAILILMWIGNNLLPAESRDTEDPTPFSYVIETPEVLNA